MALVTMSFHFCILVVSVFSMTECALPQGYGDGAPLSESGPGLPASDAFLGELIREYGSDGKLSAQQLRRLLQKLNVGGVGSDARLQKQTAASGEQVPGDDFTGQDRKDSAETNEVVRMQAGIDSKLQVVQGDPQCYSTSELMQIHDLEPTDEVDRYKMSEMCPAILQQIGMGCGSDEKGTRIDDDDGDDAMFDRSWLIRISRSADDHHDDHHDGNNTGPPPTTAEVWGYGILGVVVISACSLVGALVVPAMNKSHFQYMLMYLICLAVGSLSGGAILHLEPKSHGVHPELEYRLKSLTIIGGIYLFFFTERIMKMYIIAKKRRAGKKEMSPRLPKTESGLVLVVNENDIETSFKGNGSNGTTIVGGHGLAADHKPCGHDHLALTETDGIASVAYMIIIGDGLHNFMDGLAIAAGFSTSLISGLGICIAILCEEFPHELGDFAILLNAGMSVKKALLCNFLSACMCFVGLVCGILLTEYTDAARWIFAITCGMFLYIALVDMLPEINVAEEKLENVTWTTQACIFLLQNLGLLTGWGIMLVIGVFESSIKLKEL